VGKRLVQSWPLRLRIETFPASLRT
jgi:hypothetical protein